MISAVAALVFVFNFGVCLCGKETADLFNFGVSAWVEDEWSGLRVWSKRNGDTVFSLDSRDDVLELGYATLPVAPEVNGMYREGFETEDVKYRSNGFEFTQVTQGKDYVAIAGNVLFPAKVRIAKVPFVVTVEESKATFPYVDNKLNNGGMGIVSENALNFRIGFEEKVRRRELNRVWLRYRTDTKEKAVFGLGVQFSYLNLKDKDFVPVIITEGGVGRGLQPLTDILNAWDVIPGIGGNWHTTYSSVPMYATDRNYSIQFDNQQIMIFDFVDAKSVSKATTVVEVFANDTLHISGRLMTADSMLDIVSEMSLVTGRMPPVPDWVLSGGILGIEGGQEYVMNNTLKMLDRFPETKLAGAFLQDWCGMTYDPAGTRLLWNWEVNTKQYPDWDEVVDTLYEKGHGTRVLIYLSPNLVNASGVDGTSHNFFQEAYDKGYFVRKPDGHTPYLVNSISMVFGKVDLTNAKARSWYKNHVIKEQVLKNARVSGWMADFGEYHPFDALTLSGIDGTSYHNHFAQDWAQFIHETIDEYSKENGIEDDYLTFYRSSSLQSPKYIREFWFGDQLVSWDYSAPFSGLSHGHSDLGGYTGMQSPLLPVQYIRSQELLMRWTEMSTFSDTTLRGHSGSMPQDSAQLWSNDETMAHWSKFTNVFADLAEYKGGVLRDAYKLGHPCVRHLMFHYWDDAYVRSAALDTKNDNDGSSMQNQVINSEFLFGDCLLMAPVLQDKARSRDVYLPKGTWAHYFTKQVIHSKGQFFRDMSAPMGEPLAFVCPEF